MRLKLIIILSIFVTSIVAQGKYKKEVDSLIEASYDKYIDVQFIESGKLANKALQLSAENNYPKGKIYSYLYIARILQVVGLQMEALEYINKIENENYPIKDAIIMSETHRIKGRVASSQHLHTLEKEQYLKQLKTAENITDPKKKELSKIWAYFYIQHLYVKQNKSDSAVVYQKLLEKQLNKCKETNASRHLSSLYADKGLLKMKLGKFNEAAELLDSSLQVIESNHPSMNFYTLQIYGDLEIERGDTAKAISHYKKALENSTELNVNHKTMYLHKRISDNLMHNEFTIEEAKSHLREYNIISDSLERHNRMLVDVILSEIIKDNDETASQKSRLYRYIVMGLLSFLIIMGVFLIIINRNSERRLIKKDLELTTKRNKIGLLKEDLENNLFNDIIELAKSNSSEFLPLFGKGYPEFIETLKRLDPTSRSSELYFCALAYLNFSTKDIYYQSSANEKK